MRRLPTLAALATLGACGFDTTGLPPGHVVRDDTAADFMAAGSTLDGADLSDSGLITPAAYVTGAALAKGANSELFTDPATADWTTLDANTPARVAMSAPLADFGNGAPVGVGVAQSDNFTVWLAGEIWLEAGLHNFQLSADDNGLLDLAQPGGAFTRVVSAQWFSGAQAGTFSAPADGWYPVHMALSEGAGQAQYVLQHQPPGATALAPFDPDRLRVSASSQHGIVADAFGDFYLVRPVGRSLFAASLLDQDFGTTVPADSGITKSSLYSFHFAAQVRIDLGGDYTLTADTEDGHRLRVDGALVLDQLSAGPEQHTTAPLHLDPGWHDVVLDFTSYLGAAYAKLKVASGPDLVGAAFPLDRLRPVVPRTDRVAGAASSGAVSWPTGGLAEDAFTIAIPAGATIDGVDAEYSFDAQHARDLEVDVISPSNSIGVLRMQGDADHTGTTLERRTTHALDGSPASGAWKLHVIDRSGVDGGNLRDGAITVHYTGGRAPIATTASYESAVHDLGAQSQIDDVTLGAFAPMGTSVVVRLRTGSSADELMAQPWSDPVTSGQPPIVGAGQLVQYRVELTSDGDHSPTFDWIELVYRAAT